MAGAPKGNKNAAKRGKSDVFRIRFKDADILPEATLLTPEQRGIAIEAYIIWLESLESEEIGYLDWIRQKVE